MFTTDLRSATIADVMRRLQSSTYLRTDIVALGWGMGDAQNDITSAVEAAASKGLLSMGRDRNGKAYVELTDLGREWKFEPTFTLRYCTDNGEKERTLTATGVERIGAVVARCASREQAWGIEVLNGLGEDVTFDFACFS